MRLRHVSQPHACGRIALDAEMSQVYGSIVLHAVKHGRLWKLAKMTYWREEKNKAG